jgi:hypothetical protein
MTDPPDGNRQEPWQRFTILDVFLLQLGFALGLAWGWTFAWKDELWLVGSGTGLAFGSVLAAPIVLSVQWGLRGRRALPSVGEQLWIASFVCWLTGYVFAMLIWAAEESAAGEIAVTGIALPVCVVLLAQTVCSGAAMVWLIKRVRKKPGAVPCNWTDLFGSIACLFLGLWIWTPVLVAWFLL